MANDIRTIIRGGARTMRGPIAKHMGDYWGAPQFTNWVEESLSWKTTCYLGDWSFLPAMRFTGPDALRLFADISVNTMEKFAIGRSKHLILCNRDGMLIEDAVLSRIGDEEFIVFSTFWPDFVRRQGSYNVTSEFVDLIKLHVQGPTSLALMEQLAGESLRDIGFMRFRTIKIAGHDVVALRQGMTGELGFELQAPAEHGAEIRAEIMKQGEKFGLRQMGGRVAMINHLEASYPTHCLDYMPAIFGTDPWETAYMDELMAFSGDEYMQMLYRISGSFESDSIEDWYRSPIEMGWANRIKFDHDFIGSEALRAELANPKRTIAVLRWNSDDVVDLYGSFFKQGEPLPDFMEMPQDPRGYMYTDSILKNGEFVGITSSRGYSAYGREMISLAVVDVNHNVPGSPVEVLWGNPGTPQRHIRATIATAPYKEDRARVDLKLLP